MPSHPSSWRSIVVLLSSHWRLRLPSCLLPSGFSAKIVYAFPFSSTYVARSAYMLILIIFREEYKSQHHTLEHLSIRSSINVKDQVSHPYKTITKIIVLSRIIRMVFRRQTRQQTIMDLMRAETPWVYSMMISATKRYTPLHWKLAAVPWSISCPNAFPPKFGMKENKSVTKKADKLWRPKPQSATRSQGEDDRFMICL